MLCCVLFAGGRGERCEPCGTLVPWPGIEPRAPAVTVRSPNHWTSSELGLSRWLSGRELACQCRRRVFDPWIGKIPWRKEWQPTPVFLPGESHGQKSLVGYSSWGCKELDTTEGLSTSKKDILSATVFILFNFPTQVTCCAKVCVFPLCGKVMIH